MLVVSKNKRSQLLFRRSPEDVQPPDIVFEQPLILSVERSTAVVDELEAQCEDALVCSSETEMSLSLDGTLVLSLVCSNEED